MILSRLGPTLIKRKGAMDPGLTRSMEELSAQFKESSTPDFSLSFHYSRTFLASNQKRVTGL